MTPSIWSSPRLDVPAGKQIPVTWGALADRVVNAKPGPAKDALARWSPVTFRNGYRARANVVACHAVTLDVDDGTSWGVVADALDGLFLIAHSTFSHTEEHPRWRVVVPLDRAVDADAYERVARWLMAAIEDAGGQPDQASKDAAHAWAVPARPPSTPYVAHVETGSFCSVADALVAIPAPEPPSMTPRAREQTYDRRIERARRYLERVPPAIQGSNGSAACMWAATVLVRGFSLDLDDAFVILSTDYNARCLPPWSQVELRHKVRQAQKHGKQRFGFLAERTGR